jgi:hypothetical protein
MEKSWGRPGIGNGHYEENLFLGYCSEWGLKGYQILEEPFGEPLIQQNSTQVVSSS